ncbi:MAG: VOC family protein [Phycisphaerales bacterium]|nr:VOC family protein [Phycisphaerales bacterium]
MAQEAAIAYLLYDDAQAAVDWLVDVLGAVVTESQNDKQGDLFHAQMQLGEAVFMVGSPGPDPRYGGPREDRIHAMMLVYVPEVDELFTRLVDGGAAPLAEPADQPWGDRTCGVRDPQGQC